MTALMCTFCLAVISAAPVSVMAEEAQTEAAETAAEETEAADTEAAETEADTEAATEEEKEPIPYPEYTASEYVELGEYKGLVVVPESTEASEEEIDDEIRYYVQLAGALETVTEGTVADGDTVVIDYEGKLDGEAFDGGTAKDAELEIGSDTFIDGFEDGLIGVSVGETVDLNLTFPENYYSTDLAGKDVVFTVTVNEIKAMPELTDDLINTITEGEYTDVESYREYLRQSIEEYKESMKDSDILSQVLEQVAANSEIKDYPQVMVDYGVENMISYYKEYAEYYSMEYVDFLTTFMGMTEEEFNEQVVLAVKQNLQQELYLKAIAETEGMSVTDEEYKEGCETYAADYNFETTDALIAEYGEEMIRSSILQEKVLDFLVENAVIQEETETESESEILTEVETEA